VGTRLEVNSFHHQALDRLGDGLRAVAHSPDGVIEGIEATDRRFCVGVQWHAECLTSRPEQARLFEGLVEAAADPAARRRPRVRAA
jgi:putative glutamine amidotransferase